MNTVVQASVDSALRDEATSVLAELGMTVDEAVRILLKRVVQYHEFPLELYEPNDETIEAMRELERGEGRRYNSVAEMFADIEDKSSGSWKTQRHFAAMSSWRNVAEKI